MMDSGITKSGSCMYTPCPVLGNIGKKQNRNDIFRSGRCLVFDIELDIETM
jgi:hypothetical protein